MIAGDPAIVSVMMQRNLVEYLTYKIMVLDWTDESPVLGEEHHRAFYKDRTMPPGIVIHLFNCFEGIWRIAFRSVYIGISDEEEVSPDIPQNAKSFAVGFGNLFVFATLSTEVDLNTEFGSPDASRRLWPASGGIMFWPPRFPIDSGQAEFIANTFSRIGG